MLHWIRRGTRLFAGMMFFIVLISSLVTAGSFSLAICIIAGTYAFIAATLCWFGGFVISDIVLKGMVTHIDHQGIEVLIDGGLLQQVKMMQDKMVPGNEEQPFTTVEVKVVQTDTKETQKKK